MRHRAGRSILGFSALLLAFLVAIGTVAMMIVGVGALAGGIDPSPPTPEPQYPAPAGYKFEPWRLEQNRTICVDPRGGPPVDWSLLDLTNEAVATWRAFAPSIPLTVNGTCSSAGGDASEDGRIRWQALNGFWGITRMPAADIALSPAIDPPTRQCVGAVLLHELGHLIGLDHQPDSTSSIMNPAGCTQTITLIDIAAVRFLYERKG